MIAYRGHARVFLKDLEAIRASAIIDIIHSGETFVLEQSVQKGMKAMRELSPTPSTLEVDVTDPLQKPACGADIYPRMTSA
jgi:hypothetical protein